MQKYTVLCMHSVLCLREDFAVWRLDHSINSLNPALCWETMQKNSIAASLVHQPLIHLKDCVLQIKFTGKCFVEAASVCL